MMKASVRLILASFVLVQFGSAHDESDGAADVYARHGARRLVGRTPPTRRSNRRGENRQLEGWTVRSSNHGNGGGTDPYQDDNCKW